jgi:hypothetical protein
MMLALSGIATATASASTCKKQAGSTRGLCIANSEVLSPTKPTFSAETVETNTTLTVPSWGEGLANPIVCQQLKATGTLTPGATRSQSLTLSGYTPTFSKCAFKEDPLREECTLGGWTSYPSSGTFAKVGTTVELMSQDNGQLFNWTFTNGVHECPQTLRGDQVFTQEVPSQCSVIEAEAEKVSHTVRCEAGNSHIKHGEQAVTLGYQVVVSLTGEFKGQKFSIVET